MNISSKVSLSLKTYMSAHFLVAANCLALDAKKIEAAEKGKTNSKFVLNHRAYVISSIFMSMAFVEALINELLFDASEGQVSSFPGLTQPMSKSFSEIWQRVKNPPYPSVLDKYEEALALTGKGIFDHGTNPYQEIIDVVQLRNSLMHYKPETISTESTRDPKDINEIHKLEKRLRKKFNENPLISGGNAFYPDKCLSFGCAAWAFAVCVRFVNEFCFRLGIQAPYHYVSPRLPALTKDIF